MPMERLICVNVVDDSGHAIEMNALWGRHSGGSRSLGNAENMNSAPATGQAFAGVTVTRYSRSR